MRAWPLAVLLLAGCSSKPEPQPTPTTAAMPVPEAAPLRVPAIDDRPQPRPAPGGVAAAELPAPELEVAQAAGGWTLKASATGAAALFGAAGAAPKLAIRCDPQARTIAFALPGGGTRLRVVTASGTASFAAQPEAGLPGIVAEAPAQYTFVTQTLAHAQGGFAVAVEGAETLRLPWSRAVAQVIESCQPD